MRRLTLSAPLQQDMNIETSYSIRDSKLHGRLTSEPSERCWRVYLKKGDQDSRIGEMTVRVLQAS